MPVVDIGGHPPDARWVNYHKTGESILSGRFALRSAGLDPGREDIREGAQAVRDWLGRAKQAGVPVRPVGGAWSPSNIQTVEHGWMLNTRRFNRCFRLADGDFADPQADPAKYLLVEGGVQIDEINDKLESDEMGRSLRSTGASNGQTIAGACATGTHGSVLAAGGIQDHVRAVQIVTPNGIHWIEPAGGLMSNDFVKATGSTRWPDDDAFAAAQVPVGSLGIVTAMVIETRPLTWFQAILRTIDFRPDDLKMLAAGRFRDFSKEHGLDEEPYFVMVIVNPFAPLKRKAVVRFLYERKDPAGCDRAGKPSDVGAGYDSFTILGWLLHNLPWAAWTRGLILELVMRLAVKPITAEDKVVSTWGGTTETHKPLADIFTGALFFDRGDLARALETVCSAFTAAGGATAVTMRFMKGGHGLLSPAGWDETVGLDCDGPDDEKGRTRAAFVGMMAELDRQEIPFRRHWGKFNDLSASRIVSDYGDELRRWKEVQAELLPPDDLRLFRTQVLDDWGLTV